MSNAKNRRTGLGLLRGSLMLLKRRCGKARCRCAAGELHETLALSYSRAGRTHLVLLQSEDRAPVSAALQRYRRAARALERQALAGIALLRERVWVRKAHARRRPS